MRIAIDGSIVSTVPTGWTSRSDLTALFPAATYPGISTALGVAGLDTTSLSNGVHTIAWVVTDNKGDAAGVGSRYFTVSNGALYLAPSQTLPQRFDRAGESGAIDDAKVGGGAARRITHADR